jgi:hypothetical protein
MLIDLICAQVLQSILIKELDDLSGGEVFSIEPVCRKRSTQIILITLRFLTCCCVDTGCIFGSDLKIFGLAFSQKFSY